MQVIDLSDFDFILELDWLQKVNSVIDWCSFYIWVSDNWQKEHTLIFLAERTTVHTRENISADFNMMSYNASKKLLLQQTSRSPIVYLLILQKAVDEIEVSKKKSAILLIDDSALQALLKFFAIVF